MMIKRVEQLDHAPVVGKRYNVRAIQWGPEKKWWPLLIHAHEDAWRPGLMHYHFDMRFFDEEMVDIWRVFAGQGKFGKMFNPQPMRWHDQMRNIAIEKGSDRPPRRKVFTCHREMAPFDRPTMSGLVETRGTCFGNAIWRNGKPYCPHQGIPLATFWDGQQPWITCPVHGLKVRMNGDDNG